LKRRAGLPVVFGPRHLGLDLGFQAGVAGQPEHVVDAVLLAPSHQLLAAEAGIGAQQDAGARPRLADLADDAGHLLDRAGGGVDVGAPQLGRQQVAAAEDVERQIAVAVIVAVEEAAFLMAVQGVVGGVEIEDNLLRRRPVRRQEQGDEQPLDRRRIVGDLVVARRRRTAQFEAIERALAGDRRTVPTLCRKLAGQDRHDRVVAQFVVVVEILVAERDSEYPLADQRRHLVLDQFRPPGIGKARRKPPDQPNHPVRRSQQQRPGVRGDRPAVEPRHHRTPFHAGKTKQVCGTLCRHRGSPPVWDKLLLHNNFLRFRAPIHLQSLRDPG
jgi:hypothetical protein